MASDLVRSSENAATPAARYAGIRRSSSSTMTPPLPTISSGTSTPAERAEGRGGYFELGMEHGRPRPVISSPYRPTSRDVGSSGTSTIPIMAEWLCRNRIPPGQNVHRAQSRLSLLPTSSMTGSSIGKTSENLTPTHLPVSANTRSGAAAVNARKRRQTSGAELSRP